MYGSYTCIYGRCVFISGRACCYWMWGCIYVCIRVGVVRVCIDSRACVVCVYTNYLVYSRHTHLCTRVFIWVNEYIFIWVNEYMCVFIWVNECMCVYFGVVLYLYRCIHVLCKHKCRYMYINIYKYMYRINRYMWICLYTYTNIFTHTHKHEPYENTYIYVIYIYIYTCAYARAWIHICANTHSMKIYLHKHAKASDMRM